MTTPRPIISDDLPALAALHGAVFPEAPWDEASLTASWADGFGFCTTAGFIIARNAGKDVEIVTLAVASAARRCGHGRALVAAVIAAARQAQADRLLLDVAIDNLAALALYHNAGLTMIGRRPAYYRRGQERVDAVVLALDLHA